MRFGAYLLDVLLFYILYFMLLWDDRNQEIWDKLVGTVVVDEKRALVTDPWVNP